MDFHIRGKFLTCSWGPVISPCSDTVFWSVHYKVTGLHLGTVLIVRSDMTGFFFITIKSRHGVYMCHATKWSKMSHVYVYDGEGHVRQTNKIHCTFPRHALPEKCVTQWNCVSPSALFLAVICKFKSYFRYKYGSLLKYNTKEYPFRMKCIYTFISEP